MRWGGGEGGSVRTGRLGLFGRGMAAGTVNVALEALQISAKFGSRLTTQVGVFLESLFDELFELGRHGGVQAQGRDGRFAEDRFKYNRAALPAKWQRASGHLVEDGAEGKNVRPRIEFAGAGLFRRHVGDRSQGGSRAGERFFAAPDSAS